MVRQIGVKQEPMVPVLPTLLTYFYLNPAM